ncbi:MAG: hypothetical protein ACOX60_05400 [Massiliimalia sp.]|jgi:hypothetical protein
MKYCENWEQIQKRYEAYWAMENHDRPIVSIMAPKKNQAAPVASHHASLKDRWMDTEYMLAKGRWDIENTFRGCEAFPMIWPNLGPDVFAGLYGTQIEFGETTSWAEPHLTDEDVEKFEGFSLKPDSEYYKKLIEMTEALVEDGKDQYLVGITDIHPGADGLVSMRGPQELCFDTFDHPEFLQKGTMSLLDGFKTVYDQLYQMTTKYQKGTSNWMGIWHPERWYVTSCDFCCMVSEDMFEDLIVKELEQEVDFLDASIYHLDGPGALKHLDRLLQIKKLKGIQWVYGAGQPSASHWLEVLHKIHNAGKLIQVNVEPQELKFMLENFPCEGVMYNVFSDNEDEARQLTEMVERFGRK